MSIKYEIITNAILPSKVIPPKVKRIYLAKRLTNEQKLANRRALEAKQNAKRTKEYNSIHNKKAHAKRMADNERKEKHNNKTREKLRLKREALAGRPISNTCEICNILHKKICFDHNHKTGMFRGWLCDNCNRMIGHAKENIETLKRL